MNRSAKLTIARLNLHLPTKNVFTGFMDKFNSNRQNFTCLNKLFQLAVFYA